MIFVSLTGQVFAASSWMCVPSAIVNASLFFCTDSFFQLFVHLLSKLLNFDGDFRCNNNHAHVHAHCISGH